MARLRSEGLRGGGSPCAGVWGGLERCVEGQNRGEGGAFVLNCRGRRQFGAWSSQRRMRAMGLG